MIRLLDLQPAQAEAIRELLLVKQTAEDRLVLAFTMVVRGFGITEASAPSLTKNTLSVTVPDTHDDTEDGA